MLLFWKDMIISGLHDPLVVWPQRAFSCWMEGSMKTKDASRKVDLQFRLALSYLNNQILIQADACQPQHKSSTFNPDKRFS